MSNVVTIPFRPHKYQQDVIRSLVRWSILICHRRWGKTVLSVNWLLRKSLEEGKENWRGAYIAPLLKQAKTTAWDYLKRYASVIPGAKFNEAELRCDLPNGARISLYGADNPDALRGIYLDGVVFDEVAQMPRRVWTEVIRPALTDRKGWALFIGTPQGENALHEVWIEATEKNPEKWFAGMYKVTETDILDPDELADAKRTMDPDEFAQEFECSFTAAIRGAYYGHLIEDAEKDERILDLPHEPTLPVWTAWDLGISDSTAIWFIQPHIGGKLAVIDYYENQGQGLPHYAQVLRDKGYLYDGHIGPHDIMVRELGTGKARIEVARSLGIDFTVAPHLPVQDGIYATRAILPRCWFDRTKCKEGIKALRHYRREFLDKNDTFKDHPLHDWTSHAADALRYFAVGYQPPRRVDVSQLQRETVG